MILSDLGLHFTGSSHEIKKFLLIRYHRNVPTKKINNKIMNSTNVVDFLNISREKEIEKKGKKRIEHVKVCGAIHSTRFFNCMTQLPS